MKTLKLIIRWTFLSPIFLFAALIAWIFDDKDSAKLFIEMLNKGMPE